MKKVIAAILLCMLVISPLANVQAATKLNKTESTIYVGESTKLNLSGSKNPTWKSSDKKIVSVSKSGTVTAKDSGSATITATVKSGKSSKDYTCKIKVKDKLKLSSASVTCYLGKKAEFSPYLAAPKANQGIDFELVYDGIVKAEFSEDYTKDGYPIITVTPDQIGFTEIKVLAFFDNGKDYRVLQEKMVKVYVFPDDSGWISGEDLERFGVSTQDIDLDTVQTKESKSITYYKISDLKAQKMI